MPSHTAASSLIKLYSSGGAPWLWPAWQERTGITQGLFPLDDKDLPPGWTRQSARDVEAYFQAYIDLPTERQKYDFATRPDGGGSNYPGRFIWNTFVSRNWNRWAVHSVIVEELREHDIHPVLILARDSSLKGNWPHADTYIHKIVDSLGMKVFGEEAFPPDCDILPAGIRSSLAVFIQRSWDKIRRQVLAMRVKQDEIKAAAKSSFEDLASGQTTKAKVTRIIRAVAKWKEVAELFNVPEDIAAAEDMLGALQAVLEKLRAEIAEKQVQSKRPSKSSAKVLTDLATEDDITDLMNIYHEYFEANNGEIHQPLPDINPDGKQLNDCSGDFGMEVEKTMSLVVVCQSLGLRDCRPVQFNEFRHKAGVTPWDNESLFDFPKDTPMPDDLEFISLHWHQLTGVHSIIRSIFTNEKPAANDLVSRGVLVGDEVGLGKTAQAIATIAYLNQLIFLQNHRLALPEVVRDKPWLCGSTKIVSLPHLIVCPGTLTDQWLGEIKTLLRPKSVDIFVYGSEMDSEMFWGPEGPIRQSKQALHNCIVIASHSVLVADFKKLHSAPKKGKNVLPWDIPPPRPSKSIHNSIFGHNFLTVVVDEAHHMRNTGNKHSAALRLLQQARVRLVMTATPVHTSPKDIASMGRLVGVGHFFTEVAFAEEKADSSRMRKAKKSDDEEAVRAENVSVTRRLQDHCRGRFLRRSTDSVDWIGRKLLPLPEYTEIRGIIDLSERETAIMKDRAELAKAAVLTSTTSIRIQTKTFYLEYRTAVGYAKEDPSDPFPSFQSLEEWEPKKSTKMDVCARICSHYLTHDNVNDVSFEDGKLVLPDIIRHKRDAKQRRIIIYSEFASMAPLLQNILRLHGVPSLAINGKTPFDKRTRYIKRLYDDKDENQVLIFSSVGSAGLNLAIADVVIFFDQPWSAQDECQIRGRAHRQPQKKIMKVIYLHARDSADLLLYDMARGKRDMLDAFVNKELGEELQMLLQGLVPDVPEVEEQPDVDENMNDEEKTTKKKRQPRKKRSQLATPVDTPITPSTGPLENNGPVNTTPTLASTTTHKKRSLQELANSNMDPQAKEQPKKKSKKRSAKKPSSLAPSTGEILDGNMGLSAQPSASRRSSNAMSVGDDADRQPVQRSGISKPLDHKTEVSPRSEKEKEEVETKKKKKKDAMSRRRRIVDDEDSAAHATGHSACPSEGDKSSNGMSLSLDIKTQSSQSSEYMSFGDDAALAPRNRTSSGASSMDVDVPSGTESAKSHMHVDTDKPSILDNPGGNRLQERAGGNLSGRRMTPSGDDNNSDDGDDDNNSDDGDDESNGGPPQPAYSARSGAPSTTSVACKPIQFPNTRPLSLSSSSSVPGVDAPSSIPSHLQSSSHPPSRTPGPLAAVKLPGKNALKASRPSKKRS